MSDSTGAIIRKAYDDFAKGNVPAVFAVFDPAITWHVPGHSPLSGEYTGHAQVGGFFQRTMEFSKGAFGIDVHNVLADQYLVIALVTVKAQRNGVSASFPEAHVWRLKNGKVTGSASIKATSGSCCRAPSPCARAKRSDRSAHPSLGRAQNWRATCSAVASPDAISK